MSSAGWRVEVHNDCRPVIRRGACEAVAAGATTPGDIASLHCSGTEMLTQYLLAPACAGQDVEDRVFGEGGEQYAVDAERVLFQAQLREVDLDTEQASRAEVVDVGGAGTHTPLPWTRTRPRPIRSRRIPSPAWPFFSMGKFGVPE